MNTEYYFGVDDPDFVWLKSTIHPGAYNIHSIMAYVDERMKDGDMLVSVQLLPAGDALIQVMSCGNR
jgi:hypothetical protein